MKRQRKIALSSLLALLLVSGAVIAGGCLQGTWHYFDASGRLVGEQTVGCGELDGAWGAVTARSTFTQGCAESF
jgi:Family of unknown function (DUF6289)